MSDHSIIPHPDLKMWQADQIAECLPVSTETYGELWNRCVSLYNGKDMGEAPGEVCYDLISSGGWDRLSDEAKIDINSVIKRKADEHKEWLKERGYA